jgi:hypothetical protein
LTKNRDDFIEARDRSWEQLYSQITTTRRSAPRSRACICQSQNVKILKFYSTGPNFTPINVRYKVFKIVFGGALYALSRRDDATTRFYACGCLSDSKGPPARHAGLKARKSLRNCLARPSEIPNSIARLYCPVILSSIFLRSSIDHISRKTT